MPITKSAKKALRQSEKRRKRNLIYKEKIKKIYKEIINLLKEKKVEQAKKQIPLYYKIVDKAAKIGIIKKNRASRKKSKIMKLINKEESS